MPRRKLGDNATVDITAPCGVPYKVIIPTGYPTDPAIIRRLLAGEGDQIPLEDRGMFEAVAGQIVTNIPTCCVGGLLAKGAIEPSE